MTGYDLANHLIAALHERDAPVIGSFAWAPDRIVLDYWGADGAVEHAIVFPGPGMDRAAPEITAAICAQRALSEDPFVGSC